MGLKYKLYSNISLKKVCVPTLTLLHFLQYLAFPPHFQSLVQFGFHLDCPCHQYHLVTYFVLCLYLQNHSILSFLVQFVHAADLSLLLCFQHWCPRQDFLLPCQYHPLSVAYHFLLQHYHHLLQRQMLII